MFEVSSHVLTNGQSPFTIMERYLESVLIVGEKGERGFLTCVEVRVADPGVFDVDENLVGSGLRNGYLLVVDRPA